MVRPQLRAKKMRKIVNLKLPPKLLASKVTKWGKAFPITC